MSLNGTIALVTGASRGVGRGIAEVLGERGATVYVTGRSKTSESSTEELGQTVFETAELVAKRGGKGIAVVCDHANDANVEALFKQIENEQGRIDVLVNNVWGGYERYGDDFSASFWVQPLDRWHGMFTAGLRAHYTASRLAARMMLKQKRGLIINISAGDDNKYLGSTMYTVAKRAVDTLAWSMSIELRPYNIAAITLHAGFTRTERVLQAFGPNGMDADTYATTNSPYYNGRAVAALAEDENIMSKTGRILKVGEVAEEYGFTDIDGRRVPPFVMPE